MKVTVSPGRIDLTLPDGTTETYSVATALTDHADSMSPEDVYNLAVALGTKARSSSEVCPHCGGAFHRNTTVGHTDLGYCEKCGTTLARIASTVHDARTGKSGWVAPFNPGHSLQYVELGGGA